MSHKHPLNTFTPDFKINAVTREVIQVQPDVLITLMQYDHNSESLRFECPRFIDGHDMSLCNKVEVHFVNSDVVASVSKGGYYTVTDIAVNSDDPSLVNFSWVVSRNSTENVGTLVFSVRFTCTTGDTIDYVWHTLPFTYVSVDQGLVNELDPEYQKVYLDNLETEAAKKVVEAGNATTTALEAAERASEAINDLYSMDVTDKAPAIVCEASGEVISITDSANMPLKGLRLFGKSTQDGTPTPDAPVEIVSSENPVVSVYGKNLLSVTNFGDGVNTGNIEYTEGQIRLYESVVGDDTYTTGTDITKDASGLSDDTKSRLVRIAPGKTYVWSFRTTGATYGNQYYEFRDSKYNSITYNRITTNVGTTDYTITLTAPENATYIAFRFGISKTSEERNETFSKIQLEFGEEKSDYEAYRSVQTIATMYTLNGIPVSSGGNYTDSTGGEWICDEIDLKRGVYIKHVNANRVTKSSGNWTSSATTSGRYVLNVKSVSGTTPVCSHYIGYSGMHNTECVWNNNGSQIIFNTNFETLDAFMSYLESNDVQLHYSLQTPVEIALTETEISAYKALHTNKTNTIILNDSNAWQSVDYVADTKLYIDNKFAELANK